MNRRTPPIILRETCPTIDKAIKLIEEVRDANVALRENAEYYQAESERLEKELDEAKTEIEELQEEIRIYKEDLKTQVENSKLGIA